jgi:hypothetical protein
VSIVVLLIAAAAVAVAVYRPWSHGSSSSPPRAGAVDAKQPSNDPGFAMAPLLHLSALTAAQAAKDAASPWQLLAVDTTGRRLEIAFAAGTSGCVSPAGLFVQETGSSVLVDVLTRFYRSGACTADLQVARATVELERPLGNRSLIHAVVDARWHPVERQFQP